MKISKSQLRRILREAFDQKGYDDFIEKFKDEYQQADGSYSGHPDDPRDELASQIRNATKDLYGKKDMYDLEGKSVEELEDILFDLAHSQDQRAMDDMYRDEEEDAMGRDDDLSSAERSPRRQGMRRRPGGSKAQRRMEGINKIVREALNEKKKSVKMPNQMLRKTLKDASAQIATDVPQQFNHDVAKIIDMVVATAHQKKTGDLKRIATQVQRFSKKAMDAEKGDAESDDVLNTALSGGGSGGSDKKEDGKDTKLVKFDT